MVKVIVGIDPGIKGGIAWTDGNECGCVVMPVLNGSIDLHAVREIYLSLDARLFVIEQAQATRTEGGKVGAGGFTTGVNYGLLLGQLIERGRPVLVVQAAKWKKAHGLTGKEKEASIELAQQLFPTADLKASERAKKYHDGMAEALLLAEYGRRELLSGWAGTSGEGGA